MPQPNMSYDAYLVRLDPQDDNGYAYILQFGLSKGVKLLTPAEGDELRELLLADKELGKTVGVNGINGEGYIVLSTFPRIDELNRFFRRVASEAISNDTFYSMNAQKKAAAKAAADAAAAAEKTSEGGFRRRRSFRKSSKRALRKKSRMSRLR